MSHLRSNNVTSLNSISSNRSINPSINYPSNSKTQSPIKIKDYFINPLHRIKQPCFLQIGFTDTQLNSFVKCFTNRQQPTYLSLYAIKKFIQQFTNNNPKLIHSYEDFFIKNFQIKRINGVDNILLEEFLQFFLKDNQKKQIKQFDQIQWRKFYEKEIKPLNVDKLMEKSKELEISMSKEEAKTIVRMINMEAKAKGKQGEIQYEAFLNAMMMRK